MLDEKVAITVAIAPPTMIAPMPAPICSCSGPGSASAAAPTATTTFVNPTVAAATMLVPSTASFDNAVSFPS